MATLNESLIGKYYSLSLLPLQERLSDMAGPPGMAGDVSRSGQLGRCPQASETDKQRPPSIKENGHVAKCNRHHGNCTEPVCPQLCQVTFGLELLARVAVQAQLSGQECPLLPPLAILQPSHSSSTPPGPTWQGLVCPLGRCRAATALSQLPRPQPGKSTAGQHLPERKREELGEGRR